MSHLRFVNMSYLGHLGFAVKVSFNLFVLSVVGVIHGFCPFIFPSFVSTKVKELDKLLDGQS